MYQLIALNVPGADATHATAINGSGAVCGTAEYTTPAKPGQLIAVFSRAMIWDAGGVGTELQPGDPAKSLRLAMGINDARRVVGGFTPLVGGFTPPARPLTAYRWDPALPGGVGGTATDYVGLSKDHHYALAAAINSADVVVGTSASSSLGHGTQAVLWKNSSTIVALEGLGGPTSSAADINEHGQVTGACVLADGSEVGFLWTPETPNGTSGNMIALTPLPGGTKARGKAINLTGAVVGECSGFNDGATRGFFWLPKTAQASSGTMSDLKGLPGAGNTWPADVNSRGEVVGSSRGRAFLYRSGSMKDLNHLIHSPGWVLTDATAINEQGWIAGDGIYNGTRRAFLLIPPSPLEQVAKRLRAIAQIWRILFGVRAGEGGIAVPLGGGTPTPIDPVDPAFVLDEGLIAPGSLDLLASLAISELATLITDPEVRRRLRDLSLGAVRDELERRLRDSQDD